MMLSSLEVIELTNLLQAVYVHEKVRHVKLVDWYSFLMSRGHGDPNTQVLIVSKSYCAPKNVTSERQRDDV